MFNEGDAAALIGPCNESAALLCDPAPIALAIRRWGESSPNAPTSWANALSAKERNRLIAIVQSEPLDAACCLPWLPPNKAKRVTIDDESLGYEIDAFASASPTARMQHADMLQYLIVHAQPVHLDALTRLACAMNDAKVWLHVQMLVQRSPDAAYDVVTAVPWSALAKRVRTAILECADQSDICAAVAAAQGRTISVNMTSRTAAAFFAALPPSFWNERNADTRSRWMRA